jgi:hypothetical protein
LATALLRRSIPGRPHHLTGFLACVSANRSSVRFLALAGIAPLVFAQAEIADAIDSGGEILTMRGLSPGYAEALAVKDGLILAVG